MEDGFVSIKDLFGADRFAIPEKKKVTERGELLRYFALKLKWPIPRVAKKLEGLKVNDLYYIKSACDAYDREGNPWSKAFNGMLRVK